MIQIKDLLTKILNKYNLKKAAEAAFVCNIWNKEIKIKDTFALFFKNNILTIKVKNSTLANELKLKEKELIDKINKKIKKKLVDRLNFKF